MAPPAADSLRAASHRRTDPRDPRGIRRPFTGLRAVTVLGLLGRHGDWAALARWAQPPGPAWRGALGLSRTSAPQATTVRRAAARCAVAPPRPALTGGRARSRAEPPHAAAVDGKTRTQALGPAGEPAHGLKVFAHTVKAGRAGGPVGDGTDTEPEAPVATRSVARRLDPARAAPGPWLARVRGHGPVANGLHDPTGRWWDQGRHGGRRPGSAERFTTPRRAAVTVGRVAHPGEPDEPL